MQVAWQRMALAVRTRIAAMPLTTLVAPECVSLAWAYVSVAGNHQGQLPALQCHKAALLNVQDALPAVPAQERAHLSF